METNLFFKLIFLLPSIHSLELSVAKDNNLRIICGVEEVIVIESAVWKFGIHRK